MRLRHCEPEVIEIRNGWLAITPRDHPYRIGTVGKTPNEAERRFPEALAAWEELHNRSAVVSPSGTVTT